MAAKPTAVLVSVCLCVPIFRMLCDCCLGDTTDWQYSKGLFAFFGYAVFIILPVNRLVGLTFWYVIAIGSFLGIVSIPTAWLIYHLFVGLCEGKIVYHFYAWILLIPIYAYVPTLILIRKQETAEHE